jgi:hypothetical protein
MTRCVLLAVPLLCSLAASARAGWITFDYAVAGGGVGLAYGSRLADLGLTYGMPMSGRVSYNPSVPGEWMSDPITGGSGRVLRYSPIGSFALDVGGYTFASDPCAPLQVEWRDPSSFFRTGLFSIQAAVVSGPYGPVNPGSYLRIDFASGSAVTWGSRARVPDLGLFAGSSEQVSLIMEGADPGDYSSREIYMQGFITGLSTTATPEPGALSLAAAGAVLVLVWCRWRNKAIQGTCPSL